MNYPDVFTEKRKGAYKQVTLPEYGYQDVGITPGGVMDQFSFDCGNAILSNPEDSPALEMLLPPVLLVKENSYFVLTGPPFNSPQMVIQGNKTVLQNGTVYFAPEDTELTFGARQSGLRSYLCYKRADSDTPDTAIIKRSLNDFKEINLWADREGYIRVIEGPEYKYLQNPDDFFTTEWSVSLDTSEMGMRLESLKKLEVKLENMISEAVTTGTIQVTANGPIVLLKHRQTVGGYPRVFCVISSDVDLLAQYMPRQVLKFKKVTIEEAWQVARQKRAEIIAIRERFGKS